MLLPLPISPSGFISQIVNPALELLPERMTSDAARVMLCAIALQESRLSHRWQVIDLKRPEVKGPARGLLQFEKGGGVRGVLNHASSRLHAAKLCQDRGVAATETAVFDRLDEDDVLAAGFGRMLLWTDPKALPEIGDEEAAWQTYLFNWRPGAAKRQYDELRAKWARNYAVAVEQVK